MNPIGKVLKIVITVCISIASVVALIGCSTSDNDTQSGSYFIFDTIITVQVYSDDVTDQHYEAIGTLLERIDQSMNRQKKDSDIYRVNEQAGIRAVNVSPETFMVVQKALDYARKSEGRFDPTIGPLVDLWGIGTDHAQVPPEPTLTRKLQLVNYNNVSMNEAEQSIMLTEPHMSIDLGAIAKGYAADQIAAYLRAEGFQSAMIDLGGNILAMGTKPKQDFWTIGIQNPSSTRGETLGTLRVANKTVVSSGVYERFFLHDGIRYHHILNPFTGYPVSNNLLSVTIVTEHSIDADALSTTVFSMGLDDGISFVQSLDGVEALFITDENIVYKTPGLKNQLHVTDASYSQYEQ